MMNVHLETVETVETVETKSPFVTIKNQIKFECIYTYRFTQLKMAHLIQLYMYYWHLYTFQLLSFEYQWFAFLHLLLLFCTQIIFRFINNWKDAQNNYIILIVLLILRSVYMFVADRICLAPWICIVYIN